MSGRARPWLAVGLLAVALIALAGLLARDRLAQALSGDEPRAQRHDSMCATYTYDGQLIRWYVLVDPDTGVQYLVNDRGGATPRLSHLGDVMGVWREDAS